MDNNNNTQYHQSLIQKSIENVESWSQFQHKDFTIQKIEGGQVNIMHRICILNKESISPQSVLIRQFKQEANFDRENENSIFKQLSDYNCGPHFYFADQEYRIEEFIDNMVTPDLPHIMLKDEKYCITLAETLARFHSCNIKSEGKKIPILTDLLFNEKKIEEFSNKIQDISGYCEKDQKIIQEVKQMYDKENVEYLRNLQGKEINQESLLFCQNDLYEQNILYSKETNKLVIIDLDFSGYNYNHGEIGQYLIENSGMGDPQKYKQLPDPKDLMNFLKIYYLFLQIFQKDLKFDQQKLESYNDLQEKEQYLTQIVQDGIKDIDILKNVQLLLENTYKACIVNNFAAVYFAVIFSQDNKDKECQYLPWAQSRYRLYLKLKQYYEKFNTLEGFK